MRRVCVCVSVHREQQNTRFTSVADWGWFLPAVGGIRLGLRWGLGVLGGGGGGSRSLETVLLEMVPVLDVTEQLYKSE